MQTQSFNRASGPIFFWVAPFRDYFLDEQKMIETRVEEKTSWKAFRDKKIDSNFILDLKDMIEWENANSDVILKYLAAF